MDVIAGSTNCAPLINGYLDADNDFMDALHADGAVAGFFCYPLDTLREEEGTDKIFDFRDKLEEVFTTGDGPEVLTLTGGATGLYCGYVDFIAWDIHSALQMAKEFFEGSDIPWASFHTFRREAGTVKMCIRDSLDAMRKEDMLQVEYPNRLLLDMGWYQDRYIISIIQDFDWTHPIKQYKTTEGNQLSTLLAEAVRLVENKSQSGEAN